MNSHFSSSYSSKRTSPGKIKEDAYIKSWSKKSKVSPQHNNHKSKLVQFSPAASGSLINATGSSKQISPFRSLPDFSVTVSSIGAATAAYGKDKARRIPVRQQQQQQPKVQVRTDWAAKYLGNK